VREGTTFTHSFITAASCAPARASLFTGHYPHTTGVYKNADVWRHSWVEALAESGYHCVNIGKMHTFPYETPLGFHERFVVENKDRYLEGRYFFDRWDMALQAQGLVKQQREMYRQCDDYRERIGAFEWELPENTHSDFFVGDMATWWIRNKPQTQPLFLQIGFPGPHPPYDPIPRYAEPYLQRDDLPIPDVTEEELDGQPAAQKELRHHNTQVDHDSVCWLDRPTREQLHRQRAYYLANVTMIDEKIGEILQALDEGGYLENSVVIFTTDHGDCLGDHGHSQKWTMYDTITRTPLIVWAPGRYEGDRQIDALVQQIDIAPVIMELAGLPVPAHWEAESLTPLLEGSVDPSTHRDYVYAEQPRDGIFTGADMMTMVRNREWKLVHYLGQDDGELYDLINDPGEHRNLWADPAHTGQRMQMLDVLRDWLITSNLRTADWSVPWR
jgi:arylsulfatase A-like enzyme